MTSLRRILGVSAGLAVLSCLPACGGLRQSAARQQTSNDLKQLGLAYHSFNDVNRRGPADADELVQFAQKSGEPGLVALAEQTRPGGKYVLIWGARVPQDFPQGASITVLGHEATVPGNGGTVLMGDGSTRQMSAAEFAAAPKPKPSGAKK